MICKTVSNCVRAITSILFAAGILISAMTAQERGTMNGTVSDPQGAYIQNTNISLRWNYLDNRMSWNGVRLRKEKQPRKKSLEVSTDSAGRFSVRLLPGNWDVFAYRNGFAPTCAIVIIEAGKTANIDLRFPQLAAMPIQ